MQRGLREDAVNESAKGPAAVQCPTSALEARPAAMSVMLAT